MTAVVTRPLRDFPVGRNAQNGSGRSFVHKRKAVMKTRNTNIEKLKQHEEHRQLIHSNQCGDELAPALPTLQTGANPDKLAQLAEELRLCHQSFQKQETNFLASLKMSVAEAIKCGMILIEVKSMVGHGNYGNWLKQNTPISQKTAQRYVSLAKNKESVTILNVTTLTDCYVALGLVKESAADTNEPTTDQVEMDDAHTNTESNNSSDKKPSEFLQAKGLAVRLWNLLTSTNNPDKMAGEIEAIIHWHQQYLDKKREIQDAKERDLEFDQAS